MIAASLLCCGTSGVAQNEAAWNPPSTAQAQFRDAQLFLRRGDLENALAAVRRGLELTPRSLEGYNLLGIIYGQKKDHERSLAAFHQALRLNPRSTETHNNLGKSLFLQEKLDLAEQEFRESLSLDSRNRTANYSLGLVLLDKGEPREAITYFRRVEPPDGISQFNLIKAYLRAGKLTQALETAKLLSGQAPGDVRLHFSLGILLASEKQYPAALREFELANSLAPGTYEILHNLGQAYLRTKRLAEAEATFERALAMKPDSVSAMYLLAQTYAEQRKDLQAFEILVRVRKVAPRNADVIFLLSRLSMMHSFFEDAIRLLEEGIQFAPRRADLHAALGESYFTTGKIHKAIQEFQTLIDLEPSAWSYGFMGLSYRHLGRFEEARKYLDAGLKLDPRNTACLINLASIEQKQGNSVVAHELLERALAVNPDDVDALYEMADVKMGEREFEEAVLLLERCVKLSPNPAQVHYKLAMAHRALGHREEAERNRKVFETLSKNRSQGSQPFRDFFKYLNQKFDLPPQERIEIDLRELVELAERHPNEPRTLYLLAETYLRLGRVEEARKTLAELEKASRGDVRTAMGVGALLARYQMYSEAIVHFQRAFAADPASDDAKFNLASVYFQLAEYDQALEFIEQISSQARNDDVTLALRGNIYAHMGRTGEAVPIFQKAVEENPENDLYPLSLALTQMRAGDYRAAEETLRRSLAHIPDSGRLFWGLGIVSALQGKNAQAGESLERAADLLPEWQSSYSLLGLFYYETGQYEKARETLNQYTRLFPSGGLNVTRLQQALDSTPTRENRSAESIQLSPEARRQFLQMALAMAGGPS